MSNTTRSDARAAAEALGVDVKTLAEQLTQASAAALEQLARKVRGWNGGEWDADVTHARSLWDAAEACWAAWDQTDDRGGTA